MLPLGAKSLGSSRITFHSDNYATKSIEWGKKPMGRDYSSMTSSVPIL